MNDGEMQAKATIAAALIASGKFDMTNAHRRQQNPEAYPEVDDLKTTVEVIYNVLLNPPRK